MNAISNWLAKFLNQYVQVDIAFTEEQSYYGTLIEYDITPMEKGGYPAVLLRDDDGDEIIVFAVIGITTSEPDENGDEDEGDN